jgi:hypothetical protein
VGGRQRHGRKRNACRERGEGVHTGVKMENGGGGRTGMRGVDARASREKVDQVFVSTLYFLAVETFI